MAYDLGIDLGTTYTAAALVRDGRLEICQLGHTAHVMPSVVSLREDGTVLTGEAAERRAVTDPARTVREFKRRFGDDTPYVLGGAPFGADVLTTALLRDVLAQVAQVEGSPPDRVALAHPATWGAFKLDLLADAARQAGLAEPRFVPEPVAAALAYTQRAPVAVGAHLLVYDFGGGTFDAAVVRLDAAGPVVVGTPEGLARLGGIDVDEAVFAHVDEALGGAARALDTSEPESRAALARLRADCRAAKEALSADTEAEIPVILPTVRTSVRLTRSELEAGLRPRLADTTSVVDRVLDGAGVSLREIEAVVLVGGTSRIPLVAQYVREHTDRPVAVDVNPALAVASGAALAAAGWSGASPVAPTDPTVVAPPPPPPPLSPVAAAAGAVVGGAAVAGTADAAAADPTVVVPAALDPTGPVVGADAAGATGDDPPSGGGRRGLLIGAVALVVVLLGVGAFLVLGGSDDDGERVAASDVRSTTTTEVDETTTTADTSTSTETTLPPTSTGGGGVGLPPATPAPTAAPATPAPTAAPATPAPTAAPTTSSAPRVDSLTGPGEVPCYGIVYQPFVDITVSWKATNADSVTISRQSPEQYWLTNLESEGSIVIPVSCESTQEVVYAIAIKGDQSTTRTLTIPVRTSP